MKYALAGIAVAGLCAMGAVRIMAAQAPADRAAIEKAVMANEMKVNDAFEKRDVAALKALIAEDGIGIDMSGPNTAAEMFKQLPTMDMKITESKMSDFKFRWIDANSVAVYYTWTGKGTMMGQPVPSPVYCSSVWTKQGAKWMAVFHQETAAMAMPKK
jgi:hypothetical protein